MVGICTHAISPASEAPIHASSIILPTGSNRSRRGNEMEYSENKGPFFSFLYNPILLSSFQLSVANNWYQSHRFSVPSTMNPPTEISPSTQLLLDKIHKLFDEF